MSEVDASAAITPGPASDPVSYTEAEPLVHAADRSGDDPRNVECLCERKTHTRSFEAWLSVGVHPTARAVARSRSKRLHFVKLHF
jgi:hypothetical protein